MPLSVDEPIPESSERRPVAVPQEGGEQARGEEPGGGGTACRLLTRKGPGAASHRNRRLRREPARRGRPRRRRWGGATASSCLCSASGGTGDQIGGFEEGLRGGGRQGRGEGVARAPATTPSSASELTAAYAVEETPASTVLRWLGTGSARPQWVCPVVVVPAVSTTAGRCSIGSPVGSRRCSGRWASSGRQSCRSSLRMQRWPTGAKSWRTVVNGGQKQRASSMSSKPTTLMSPGTSA